MQRNQSSVLWEIIIHLMENNVSFTGALVYAREPPFAQMMVKEGRGQSDCHVAVSSRRTCWVLPLRGGHFQITSFFPPRLRKKFPVGFAGREVRSEKRGSKIRSCWGCRRRRGGMKILCNACEAAESSVFCCADEAALCWACDQKVHAANKLASKHQRVPLTSSSSSLVPKCDICQARPPALFPFLPFLIAFIATVRRSVNWVSYISSARDDGSFFR